MAWIAGVISALSQADSAATPKAGASPQGAAPPPFTPSANAFAAGQKQGAGADLSTAFSKSALPAIPQGQNGADVFRIADALGKTDLSGAPPPVPGPAAAGATPAPTTADFGAGRPTIGGADMMAGMGQPAAIGAAGGAGAGPAPAGGDWLSNAQQYAQLGAMAQNALKGPQLPGGGIPQAAPMSSYSPTAGAAMARIQQLMAMRRGGGF